MDIIHFACASWWALNSERCAAGTFLAASAAASFEFAHLILPANMQPPQLSYVDEALAAWSQRCQEQPPTDAAAHHQKTWDSLRLSSIVDTLSSDQMHRARFLATSCKESGVWLNALPISSLGLRMDDATVRISMGITSLQKSYLPTLHVGQRFLSLPHMA